MKESFLSHENAALLNRNVVLNYIRKRGAVSRTDIWEAMDISRASVTQVIRQLEAENLILEEGKISQGVGRAKKKLVLNASARMMYIFDWNSRQLCLTNFVGEVLERTVLSFPGQCIPTVFKSVVLEGVKRLNKAHPVAPNILLGIGFSMPGLIDSRSCMVLYSTELGWRDVDMQDLFAHELPGNVYLERTGNMIALGEYEFGAGKSVNHFLLVLLENEGLGASVVIRGDCQHGGNYMYGELGHMKLDSDVICSCGQRGCIEAVIRNRMMQNGGIVDEQIIKYISLGVSAAVNLLDPGLVLLSGKLVNSMDGVVRSSLAESIRCKVTNERSRDTKIEFSNPESDMGIRGMSVFIFLSNYKIHNSLS